jgi:hypothetical protein
VKTYSLISLSRRLNADREGFATKYAHPWLVWSPPVPAGEEQILTTDVTGLRNPDFSSGPPVALPVIKAEKNPLPNAFPFGITIGHAENNDIVIRHQQVSRFHAYLQRAGEAWVLVDADSKNGTWIDGRRLQPSKPTPLPSRARLLLGEVQLEYFEPFRLIEWLDAQARGER